MSAFRPMPSEPDSFSRWKSAIERLQPDASPEELACQIVEAATHLPDVLGARLWRSRAGLVEPWCEAGQSFPSDTSAAEQVFASGLATVTGLGFWVCTLGEAGAPVAILEVSGAHLSAPVSQSRLELFARYAGMALAGSQRRRAMEELSAVIEATKRLNSTLDLGELIHIILQLATREAGADRGTVFLYDRTRGEIWSLVGLGLEQREIRLPTSKGIAGWVALNGEPVRLRDAYADSRFAPDVDRELGYTTRALLALPIRNKDGDVIGVLQLLNKLDHGRPANFTADDQRFLETLSDHVALALENAQLLRERLTKQRLERDLAVARHIQECLLPEHPPEVPGIEMAVAYRASQMVSGDYYDFILLDPTELLILVADVEGKGVAAALVMANLQAALRPLILQRPPLEELAAAVNRRLASDTRTHKSTSMFLGRLHLPQRTLKYVNAGHVPPQLVRASGESVSLTEGGMVLGYFADVPFTAAEITLQPGDVLVAATDGITEAADPAGTEYGSERLLDAVSKRKDASAQRIVDEILAEVEQFSADGRQDDDRILLVLKAL